MKTSTPLFTFDLTLRGYRSDTDKTDYLVKWVNAPSRQAVLDYAESAGLTPHSLSVNGSQHLGQNAKDYGVDMELDADGRIVWGQIGRTTP